MKRILLCIAVVFLLLAAGCTQTAQQGQPAATVTTKMPTHTSTTSAPVAAAATANAVTTTASVSDNTVLIQNMAYNPAQITVKAGEIVRWVNRDKVVHSVVFSTDSKINPSGALSASQSFSVKFDEAGVYKYSCGIHPQMQGSVVVT
ncbi:plastocyanin/azurin family copper-binding protein [Methanoregula sp.]|uniref:plastocyanin/azurin family copper-binding protein n=1 Tax=Methanoregula sp. TaxID=2052170 RepID=UPI003563FA7D